MNKFKNHLYTKGKWIGEGSSRVAYELGDRVYKIPYRSLGVVQSMNEQRLYGLLRQKFEAVFPAPHFHSNGVVSLDKVQLIDELIGSWSDSALEEIVEQELVPYDNVQFFLEFAREAEEVGASLDDLVANGANIGVQNGLIKVIDWGYTSAKSVFEFKQQIISSNHYTHSL